MAFYQWNTEVIKMAFYQWNTEVINVKTLLTNEVAVCNLLQSLYENTFQTQPHSR